MGVQSSSKKERFDTNHSHSLNAIKSIKTAHNACRTLSGSNHLGDLCVAISRGFCLCHFHVVSWLFIWTSWCWFGNQVESSRRIKPTQHWQSVSYWFYCIQYHSIAFSRYLVSKAIARLQATESATLEAQQQLGVDTWWCMHERAFCHIWMSTANSYVKFHNSISWIMSRTGICPDLSSASSKTYNERKNRKEILPTTWVSVKWTSFWDAFLAGYVWQAQKTFPSLLGGARGVLPLEVKDRCKLEAKHQKNNWCSGRTKWWINFELQQENWFRASEGNLTRVHSGSLQRAPGLGGGRADIFV